MPEVTESTPDRKPWIPSGKLPMTILNLQEMVNAYDLHMAIRSLAGALMITPKQYITVGEFFYSINNMTVSDLYDMQANFDEDFSKYLAGAALNHTSGLKNLTTLCLLLARAEGYPEIKAEVIQEVMPQLCKLIQQEKRYRNGTDKKAPDYKKMQLFTKRVEPNIMGQYVQ